MSTPRPSHLVFALCAAVTLLLAGCKDDDCGSDFDCAIDQLCVAGSCAQRCADDVDCTFPRSCESGACVLPRRCQTENDCPGTQICEQSICVEQTPECSLDSQCPPNFQCCQGGCYAPGTGGGICGACESNEDCPGSTECIGGSCVLVTGPDAARDAGTDAPIPTDVAEDAPPEPDTADDIAGPDAPADIAEDADEDTARPDVAPDVAPDAGDGSCTFNSDCTDGWECVDGVCLDPGAPCELAEFRDRCDARADCCSELCVGNPETGSGTCTQLCEDYRDCNPIGMGGDEMFCATVDSTNVCAFSDYGNACFTGGDCLDTCLVAATGNGGRGDRICSYSCDSTADCRPGTACGLVAANRGGMVVEVPVCAPVTLSGCVLSTDCLSGTCLSDDETGVSYCTTICEVPGDASPCPPGYDCTPVGDGIGSRNVCVLR